MPKLRRICTHVQIAKHFNSPHVWLRCHATVRYWSCACNFLRTYSGVTRARRIIRKLSSNAYNFTQECPIWEIFNALCYWEFTEHFNIKFVISAPGARKSISCDQRALGKIPLLFTDCYFTFLNSWVNCKLNRIFCTNCECVDLMINRYY